MMEVQNIQLNLGFSVFMTIIMNAYGVYNLFIILACYRVF
jgi:hypothetical protein